MVQQNGGKTAKDQWAVPGPPAPKQQQTELDRDLLLPQVPDSTEKTDWVSK